MAFKLKRRVLLAVFCTMGLLFVTKNIWYDSLSVELLIIILVLSSLFTYKLVDYIANFSSIKNKSRVDIFFLAMFFIMLFIPVSHINHDEKSLSENRMLAKWKPLITQEGSLNCNFGKDFESWFNDRFNTREFLVSVKSIIPHKTTNKVIVGKKRWLFLNISDGNTFNNYLNKDLLTDMQLKKTLQYLSYINEYCKKNNKHFYLLICPDKHKIYGEFFPDYVIKNISDEKSRANQLIQYLNKNSDIKVVYPYEELMAQKQNEILYWKTDSHWNDYGAFQAYKLLMKNIISDDKTIKPLTEYTTVKRRRPYGDLARTYPKIIRKADKTKYVVYKFNTKYDEVKKFESSAIREDVYTTSEEALNDKKVIFFRDSFCNNLVQFFSRTFKTVTYLRKHNIDVSCLKDYDIIVLEIVERNIPTLAGCLRGE